MPTAYNTVTMNQETATPWVKTWYDNQGREVKTESIGPKNVSLTSTTTYNNKGLATRRTEPSGVLSLTHTYTYDDRGNRSSMTDPDAGTTTYTYDALGREIGRTDARGVVFVTKYDYLGRVTQQKADDATINYTYGSSGTGQMRLISESNGTWSKNYTYDAPHYGDLVVYSHK